MRFGVRVLRGIYEWVEEGTEGAGCVQYSASRRCLAREWAGKAARELGNSAGILSDCVGGRGGGGMRARAVRRRPLLS